MRRDLADEAMRLGRVLAALLPREPEVHGLVALMELQASRFDARTGPTVPVLLQDQDRGSLGPRPDRARARGAGHRDRRWAARSARTRCRPRSPACHARARVVRGRPTGRRSSRSTTRWPSSRRRPSSSSTGPSRCCTPTARRRRSRRWTRSGDDPRLARYHLLGAVRGDVLARLGRWADAAEVLEHAADLAPTQRERNLLMERAAAAAAKG